MYLVVYFFALSILSSRLKFMYLFIILGLVDFFYFLMPKIFVFIVKFCNLNLAIPKMIFKVS